MTKGVVFIATSLDGFIARENGDIDWLTKQNTDGEDHGYNALMASVGGLVMGRGSYETLAGFDTWPYQKPVIVLSKTLNERDLPDRLRGKVSFSRESPAVLMKRLNTEGWKAAYIDGGLIVQSFLRDGLIDEIILTRIPILLGAGKPLFGSMAADVDLVHISTKSFPSGLVQSTYHIKR